MGGRGGSSGLGPGGNVKIIVDTDGSEIDLSDSPLTYGKDDAALTDGARTKIESFEDKRRKSKIEFGLMTDADGNTIEERRGSKGSVKLSFTAALSGKFYTHNHPREAGVLGGTFSTADLDNFIRFNQTTYRAAAKEGTYSITKGPNFDGKGLSRYYKAEHDRISKDANAAIKNIEKQVRSGSISYADYLKMFDKQTNAMLVGLHNALLAGASKYGYSYTLERRKK